MTTHTDNFHALAVDNIKMQAEQFRELSAEELEMASGGGFGRHRGHHQPGAADSGPSKPLVASNTKAVTLGD